MKPDFWQTFGALAEIEQGSCVIIAAFTPPGADSPIVLDLSQDPAPVLMLRWLTSESDVVTTWERIAPDFGAFIPAIGIS